MINCVYLNPTIDYTVYVDEFRTGVTNIAEKAIVDGAGKAVNVAEALVVLGSPSKLFGFAFKSDVNILRARLRKSGLQYNFIELDGSSRVNIKIFDNFKKQVTEINGQGLPVDFAYSDSIITLLSRSINPGEFAVLAGKLPFGWPQDFYAKLIRILSEFGVFTALDTSGEALRLGISAGPYIIKPNIEELEAYAGHRVDTFERIEKVCLGIFEYGIKLICVSMGERGAYMFEPGAAYFAEPVNVPVRSTVGAGDSMMAGILAKINCGVETAFKSGVAAAAASLTVEGTGFPPAEVYDDLFKKVNISRV